MTGKIDRWLIAALAALALAAGPAAQDDGDVPSVGVPARMEGVVLRGGELEVVPADLETPLVLRITGLWPHGDGWRYDLEYYGLEPGDYDLTAFLRRIDGTPTEGLAPLPVTVRSVLPADRLLPNSLDVAPLPLPGGYTTIGVLLAVTWLAGLGVFLAHRKRPEAEAAPEEELRPRTLSERLRPLVEDAVAGRLPREAQSQLELGLIAYWRRELDLEDVDAATAMARLKDHPSAGPLLRQLEDWLHRPRPAEGAPPVDVAGLLAPYQDLPADALDEAPAAGARA